MLLGNEQRDVQRSKRSCWRRVPSQSTVLSQGERFATQYCYYQYCMVYSIQTGGWNQSLNPFIFPFGNAFPRVNAGGDVLPERGKKGTDIYRYTYREVYIASNIFTGHGAARLVFLQSFTRRSGTLKLYTHIQRNIYSELYIYWTRSSSRLFLWVNPQVSSIYIDIQRDIYTESHIYWKAVHIGFTKLHAPLRYAYDTYRYIQRSIYSELQIYWAGSSARRSWLQDTVKRKLVDFAWNWRFFYLPGARLPFFG